MKILMQSRYDILTKRGGDTVQMEQTKKALENLGVTVDVSCSPNVDLKDHDLVHLFNLDWIQETYRQAKNSKRQNIPFVLSPIHHRLRDIRIWEDTDLYDFKRLIYPLFKSYDSREFLKGLYKAFLHPRELHDLLGQLGLGVATSQKWVVQNSAHLLPNAYAEAEAIKEDLGISNFKFSVIPNGVSPAFYNANPATFKNIYGDFPFVLSVGRIESRKNQLRIIEAVKVLRQTSPDLRLVLVGSFNPHHFEYCWRVKKELSDNPWIMHLPQIPYDEMPSIFAASKSHVLASWKETTGLVNLEAALAGCGVVAPNKGYCREYLGDEACYCDPASVASIVEALKLSFDHKPSESFKQSVLRDFTWEQTAKKTLAVYNELL